MTALGWIVKGLCVVLLALAIALIEMAYWIGKPFGLPVPKT